MKIRVWIGIVVAVLIGVVVGVGLTRYEVLTRTDDTVYLQPGESVLVMAVAPIPTDTPTMVPTYTPTVVPTDTPVPTVTPAVGIVIPDNVKTVDGNINYTDVKPGDILLIPSTRTTPITFRRIRGEEGNPVVIINHGGKVSIDGNGNWVGIQLRDCEHIRLTGTGDPSIEYGFEIFNVTNCGVTTNTREGTQHVEINHVEVHDSDGGGIRAGQAGNQTRETWRGVGFYLHHNYVHDVENEGFYVGSSHWKEGIEPEIEDVELAYNKVERCGSDGIQVGSAIKDVRIHHNYVKDVGLDPSMTGGNTRTGLVINQGTTGDWYNNVVVNAGMRGMIVQGIGGYKIFNNVIWQSDYGIRWWGGSGEVYNNTIVDMDEYGIRVSSGCRGTIFDNIVVGSGISDILNKNVEAYNNLTGEVGKVGFVDAENGDFHLLSGSPAIDVGNDAVLFDLDGTLRPQGERSDIGAYEHVGGE